MLISPSASGLRKLLTKFGTMITSHDLRINVNKTKAVIFHKGREKHKEVYFELLGEKVENVETYKYLGIIMKHNLKITEDVKRMQGSFNRKAGMFFRKFYSVNCEVKINLFNSLCLDFYGIENWWNTAGCQAPLKQLAVSYHYALKKLLGYPKRTSNHFICYVLDKYTLEHLHNIELLKYYRWLCNSSSPCFAPYKEYFMRRSALRLSLEKMFFQLGSILIY